MINAHPSGDKLVLALTGTLDAEAATKLLRAVRRPLRARKQVVLDLSGVQSADAFGVAALAESVLMARRRPGASLRATGAQGSLREQLASQGDPEEMPAPKAPGFLEQWGGGMFLAFDGLWALMQLLADTAYWCIIAPLRRKLPPPGATTDQAVRIGLDAAPIVMLIGFLMGLIMAFQAAYQLRQFGANIYVANLVGLAMVRELGPLMTAIIIAGRSGSAIAAELGTMTVGEEIDALRTMGIDPIRFLVVPRVYAISMTQPALSLFAMGLGIMGGFLIAVFFLDLSASAYLKQTISSLQLANLFEGLTKSLVFAWVIVMIGCHSGLRITGGAVGVGRATTTSVVASIFSIIIVDSVFTTLSTILG
jgi:phospholipid/cholesterol/gamma-HCH transport system permease protein